MFLIILFPFDYQPLQLTQPQYHRSSQDNPHPVAQRQRHHIKHLAAEDQINVPANAKNQWKWRMKMNLETLLQPIQ
jgi:hypothetical protein